MPMVLNGHPTPHGDLVVDELGPFSRGPHATNRNCARAQARRVVLKRRTGVQHSLTLSQAELVATVAGGRSAAFADRFRLVSHACATPAGLQMACCARRGDAAAQQQASTRIRNREPCATLIDTSSTHPGRVVAASINGKPIDARRRRHALEELP